MTFTQTIELQHSLADLLADIIDSETIAPEVIISGLALDSRQVKPGDLFFAFPGVNANGCNFIDQALANGALAVVYEASNKLPYLFTNVPLIAIDNVASKIGAIASRFFTYPSARCHVIAVTGTNGKSSLTHYVASMLTSGQRRCAVLGTVGNGFLGELQPAALTTESPINLQRMLFNLSASGAKAIALEASSHALVQHRLAATEIDIAVWTNLTRDHLDYHPDIESYFQAKKMLFNFPSLKHAVINLDCPFSSKLLAQMPSGVNVVTYTIKDVDHGSLPCLKASAIHLNEHGVTATLRTPWGDGVLRSSLLGHFNVSNIMGALACCLLLGTDLSAALQYVENLKPVPGRMQVFQQSGRPRVVVDFAHTPLALDNALQTVAACCQGKVWCVFGCGGDRDHGKRAQMGRTVESHGAKLVITNDNPRTEDPMQIVDDICSGLVDSSKATIECDRKQAINYAINHADSQDWVLVAGKGHEDYQILGDERIAYSDLEYVAEVLGAD